MLTFRKGNNIWFVCLSGVPFNITLEESLDSRPDAKKDELVVANANGCETTVSIRTPMLIERAVYEMRKFLLRRFKHAH